ncbi:hypothetical protein FBU31_006915 [Coemansia sp. 'formosensis']|nr:hypothetical protein FBU31_006915 [Coemansia sp. 'formosensis']
MELSSEADASTASLPLHAHALTVDEWPLRWARRRPVSLLHTNSEPSSLPSATSLSSSPAKAQRMTYLPWTWPLNSRTRVRDARSHMFMPPVFRTVRQYRASDDSASDMITDASTSVYRNVSVVRSYTWTLFWSSATSSRLQSLEMTRSCTRGVATCLTISPFWFHIMTLRSMPPERILPVSPSHLHAVTVSSCPENTRRDLPVSTSHSRSVRSLLADTICLLSGDQARHATSNSWPSRRCTMEQSLVLHTMHVLSHDAEPK